MHQFTKHWGRIATIPTLAVVRTIITKDIFTKNIKTEDTITATYRDTRRHYFKHIVGFK
jgi:hypothetical protein